MSGTGERAWSVAHELGFKVRSGEAQQSLWIIRTDVWRKRKFSDEPFAVAQQDKRSLRVTCSRLVHAPLASVNVTPPKPDRSEIALRVILHTGLAAATVPLGPSGPPVATAGALILDAVLDLDKRAWANLGRGLESAASDADMNVDAIAEWITPDDRHAMLARDAVQAMLATLDEERLDALSRVLTAGLRDDAKVDSSRLMVRALASLDPTHLQVLGAMILDTNQHDANARDVPPGRWFLVGSRRWDYATLSLHLPHIGNELSPVLATLETQGLIMRSNDNHGVFHPTGFGVECFNYLRRRPVSDTSQTPG